MIDQTGSNPAVEARVDALLVGAIDPHVHSGPSIAARSVDHLELARDCSAAGFAAIVTKDHDYAGVMTAWLINKHFPELTTKVYSSIVLNNVVGGLNPYAVEHTAAMGGKVVWLPTLTAENHFRWEKTSGWVHPASTTKIRPASVIPVTVGGKVVDAAKEILDVCARTDMALASGHIHASETAIVFEEAKRRGVKRLIFTHPEDIVGGTVADVKAMAGLGAYIEHSLCMFLEGNKFKSCDESLLDAMIKAATPDMTIFCSDLGQVGTFHPIDGFRRGIRLAMHFGYSDDDIRKMVSTNAARVLGMEADVAARKAA
jgi:hypothetical protein